MGLIPKQKKDANKYSHGTVAVMAGSAKYPGAAVLCVGGARRGGSGYVNYLVREEFASKLVLSAYPDVVPISKANEFDGDAWVIGSGAPKLPAGFIFPESRYLVLDGDAMALAKNSDTAFTVITPHEGEAAKLGFPVTSSSQRTNVALAMAKKFHVIVVLKGANSVIAGPDGKFVIDKTGGPELATAGTGDILAGLIGSSLASNKPTNMEETLKIVALAVKTHGLAGKLAARSSGYVTATDLLEALPLALKA